MKDKIKNIAEKLEHQIRMHELDLNDRIKDIPQIILLLEQGFSELKEIVSFYKFKSEMDEIFFFKIIKPKFFSKLIYYRKVYNIEMMRPNGQDCVLKNYFINELNQLENFYNKNIDFYKYYRSGSTHLDKYFFLRGKQDIQMTMETFYFERDPNFSTICDFKVAKIVANEMLRIYLNPKIRNYQTKGTVLLVCFQCVDTLVLVLKHAEGMSLRCDAICTIAYCGRHESSHIVKAHADLALWEFLGSHRFNEIQQDDYLWKFVLICG